MLVSNDALDISSSSSFLFVNYGSFMLPIKGGWKPSPIVPENIYTALMEKRMIRFSVKREASI
jgi:hypothetical protein